MWDEQCCRLDDLNVLMEDEIVGKREMGVWFLGQGYVKNYLFFGFFQFKVIWVNFGKFFDQVVWDFI